MQASIPPGENNDHFDTFDDHWDSNSDELASGLDSSNESAETPDDDGLSLAEASDADDLVDLDDDVPIGIIENDSVNDSDADEWSGVEGSYHQKRKRTAKAEHDRKRRKLRSLPTFASYEEYARLIEEGPEDDI
jgi:ribosome biogenesis protein MAK21